MSLLKIEPFIINSTANFVFDGLTVTSNLTSGNASLGNLATASYFSGNGTLLSSINGSNISGQVGNALVSGTVYTNAQPNITSVGTLTTLTVTGNITSGNANLGNAVVANYFIGDGSLLTGLSASYSNTNVAAYLPTYTGNLTAGNANVTGNITATYFIGNGSQLTGLPASYSNTNVAAYLPTYSGNLSANYITGTQINVGGTILNSSGLTSAGATGNISGANYIIANYFTGTLTTAAQPNITSVGSLSGITVSGDATITGNLTVSGTYTYANVTSFNVKDPIIEQGGNPNGTPLASNDGKDRGQILHYYSSGAIDAFMGWDNSNAEFSFGSNVSVSSEVVTFNTFGNVRAGYYLGNGSQLSGVIATSATTAGTVTTAAQPNITSTGTLSSLTVTGNVTSGNANLGNAVVANYFVGNGSLLTGLPASYSNTNVAAYLPTYTGNLSANYITGTQINVGGTILNSSGLTSAGATGNISGANYITANYFTGTLVTGAQPNITSTGTLTSLTVTANITSGNANLGNAATANYFVGNGSLLTGITSTYSNTNVAAYLPTYTGNFTAGNANVTGNVTVGNLTTGGGSGGNLTGANYVVANYFTGTLTTAAQPNITSTGTLASLTVTGNVTANYFIGNGSQLTGLPASYSNTNVAAYLPTYTGNFTAGNANVTGNVTVGNLTTGGGSGGNLTGANYVVANYFTGTLTTAAQPNITSVGTLASLTVTANITSGNANLGNLATSNYFTGNGSLLTSLTGANVSGYVPLATAANTAGTVTTAAQPNITSTGTLASLTVTGVITATSGGLKVGNIQDPSGTNTVQLSSGSISVTGNITAGAGGSGNVTATYFIGNGSQLTGITSTYSNTNVAAYLPTYTGNFTANYANISNTLTASTIITTGSSGNITGANYINANYFTATANIVSGNANLGNAVVANYFTATANIVSGNANLGNAVVANYFVGNGSLLTGLPASYSNTNVAAYLPTYTGNLTAGNANLGNAVVANYFVGNGSLLTGLPASYSNTNVAAYLPTYTGNFTAGNVNVGGTMLSSTGITTTGAAGNISGANYVLANYFTGTLTTGAQPNITSTGTLTSVVVSGDATITGNLTVSGTYTYANVTSFNVKDPIIEQGGNPNGTPLASNDGKDRGQILHYYSGAAIDGFMGWDNSNAEFAFGSNVSVSSEVVTFNSFGNLRASYYLGNGSQLTGVTATTATTAGTVTTAAQPNITSVGTLSSLTVTANISSGNANLGNLATSNYFSGNGSLLTSLTGSNVSGNVTSAVQSHYANIANSVAGGNVSGQVSNALVAGTVYTNAQPNITSVGTLSSLTVTANITSGNANLGNAATANYFLGNGSQLTGITATTATTAATVTTNAQPNITSVGSLSGLTVSNATGIVDFTTTANVTLGNVSNLHISGGTANYVLSTDGSGSLSWVAQSGGGGSANAAGSNTQVQFNDGGSFGATANFAFNKTSNVLSVDKATLLNGANLGSNISNIYMGGGGVSQILATDGSGNLTWVAQPTAVITVDNFTGNGVQTAFTLSTTPSSINQTVVNYNGAFQLRSAYTLTGPTLTFSEAPVSGSNIEVTTTMGATSGAGAFVSRSYTGDGSQANYTVTSGVTVSSVLVTENGIVQTPTTDYTVSGSTLTFTTAPGSGVGIQIRELAIAIATTVSPAYRAYTGNGVANTFTITSGLTANSLIVAENGIIQRPTTDYTVSGSTVTFATAPASGVDIQIRELSLNGGMSTGGTSLPTQSGNSGKYLTTDGATASWANVTSGVTLGKTVALNMFIGF